MIKKKIVELFVFMSHILTERLKNQLLLNGLKDNFLNLVNGEILKKLLKLLKSKKKVPNKIHNQFLKNEIQ